MSKIVVVVDDSKLSRMHVRGIILRNNPEWRVIEAGNSVELSKVLSESDIHIAVIDFNMPGENGLEAAIRLRAERPHVHIALITANAQDAVLSGIRDLGAAFMPKPVEEELLLRFLAAAALPRRATQGGEPQGRETHDSRNQQQPAG